MTIVRRICINDVYKVSVELKQTTKRVNHRNEVTCLAASCPTRCTAPCATNRDGSGSMCALTETLQRGGQLKTSPFHRHSTCRNVCSARVLRSASKMTVSSALKFDPDSYKAGTPIYAARDMMLETSHRFGSIAIMFTRKNSDNTSDNPPKRRKQAEPSAASGAAEPEAGSMPTLMPI